MGYETEMQRRILALLDVFGPRIPDPESHGWVRELVAVRSHWCRGHQVFDDLRDRNLRASKAKNVVHELQYCFEEVCVQVVYNESHPDDPFDSTSPFWIAPLAFQLARALGVPFGEVVEAMGGDG